MAFFLLILGSCMIFNAFAQKTRFRPFHHDPCHAHCSHHGATLRHPDEEQTTTFVDLQQWSIPHQLQHQKKYQHQTKQVPPPQNA